MPAKIPIGFLLTSKELFLGSAQAMYGNKPSTKSTVILSGTKANENKPTSEIILPMINVETIFHLISVLLSHAL